MSTWSKCAVTLVLLIAFVSQTGAQTTLPDAPAAPAVPAAPPAAGIVGLVQLLAAKCAACKAQLCACPLGQLITNATQPLNTFGGGLICPPCCPPINPNDLKKPPTSAQGACARIRQEEADAPARRAAVRCLTFANCHWYPEAETALVTALRTDRNECVRWEAATALSSGCCCSKKTIEALTLTVTGSNKDGNPSEDSERVKAAAEKALNMCLARYQEVSNPQRPELPPPADAKPPAAGPGVTLQPVAARLQPEEEVWANARRALEQRNAPAQKPATTAVVTGRRNLYHVFVDAVSGGNSPRLPADEQRSAP